MCEGKMITQRMESVPECSREANFGMALLRGGLNRYRIMRGC